MIKPVGNRVLIKPEKLEDIDPVWAKAKAAGIQIPDTHMVRQERIVEIGTVLEIGENAWDDFQGPCWCKVGDKVGFTKYGGKIIKYNDEEFYLLEDIDILCVYS